MQSGGELGLGGLEAPQVMKLDPPPCRVLTKRRARLCLIPSSLRGRHILILRLLMISSSVPWQAPLSPHGFPFPTVKWGCIFYLSAYCVRVCERACVRVWRERRERPECCLHQIQASKGQNQICSVTPVPWAHIELYILGAQ